MKQRLTRILLFCYDFPHAKSTAGVVRALKNNSLEPMLWSAPFISINGSKEPTRIKSTQTASEIAAASDVDACVAPHWDEDALARTLDWKPDLGLVLGARRLRAEVVNSLGIPILNVHPGVLPENRGLDAVPWAVRLSLPLGVSIHSVDERLDAGKVAGNLIISNVPKAVHLGSAKLTVTRLHDTALSHLIDNLHRIKEKKFKAITDKDLGKYHSRQDTEDIPTSSEVSHYQTRYQEILRDWESRTKLDYQKIDWCRTENYEEIGSNLSNIYIGH